MSGRSAILAGLVALLVAGGSSAQPWTGPAGLEVRVSGRDGGVAGAVVRLSYRSQALETGPSPVTTDGNGRATLTGLAGGTWQVEISHPDYMTFVAVVELAGDDKPEVTASFLEATDRSTTSMKVRFGKARGPASPPLLLAEEPAAEPARPAPSTVRPEAPTSPHIERPTADDGAANPPDAGEPPARPEPPPPPATPEPDEPPAPAPSPPEPPSREPEPPAEPEEPPAGEPAPPEPEEPVVPVPPETEPEPTEPPAKPAPIPEPDEPVTPEPAEPPETEPEPAEPPATGPAPAPAPDEPEPPAPAPEPEEPEPPLTAPESDQPPATRPAPAPEPAEPPETAPEPEAPRAPAREPEVPGAPVAPAPTTPPIEPTVAPAPAPAPLPPPALPVPEVDAVRSYSRRTCVECRPGEWAVAARVVSAGGAGCSRGDLDGLDAVMAAAADTDALELEGYAGPLEGARGLLDGETASALDAALAGLPGGCVAAAVVLPRNARFSAFQYEASAGGALALCLPDQPCEGAAARWHGPPHLERGANATVAFGLFHSDIPTAGYLTVYFQAATPGWEPGIGR